MALNGNIETGKMPINPDQNIMLIAGEQWVIGNGYHSGNTVVTAKTLAEQTAATAVSDNVVANYFGWVDGRRIYGNYIERAENTECLSIENNETYDHILTFPRGFYTNSNKNNIIATTAQLVQMFGLTSNKVADGKTQLGVSGTYTSDATAIESDLAYGYFGYAGDKIVGNLRAQQVVNASCSVDSTSCIVSWDNPPIGPYQGVIISVKLNGDEKASYTGHGSNGTVNARSFVSFTNLNSNTAYTIEIKSYAGDLTTDVYRTLTITTTL